MRRPEDTRGRSLCIGPGEAVVEDAAIEVTVDDHFDIRTKKAILFGKTVVVDLLKFLKVKKAW